MTIYELGEHEGTPSWPWSCSRAWTCSARSRAACARTRARTLPIVLQLLAGLGHAHENGIVHRDVKPSNLFLPRKRPAKIMDFGVARLARRQHHRGGTRAGSWARPTTCRRAGAGAPLDGRSDLFSAGLILYELVTGEKAYKGDTVVALLYKIAHEPADLGLIPRGPPWERLRQVLARALDHDRDRRYADARAMSARPRGGPAGSGRRRPTGRRPPDWGVVSRATPTRRRRRPSSRRRRAGGRRRPQTPRRPSRPIDSRRAAAAGRGGDRAGGRAADRVRR